MGGGENGYSLITTDREQIVIAGDDEIALDGERARAAETETAVGQTGLPERDIKIARVGQITDEAGRVTTYQYAYDRLTRQYTITTFPPGGPNTVACYDREGRLLERTVGGERQRVLTRDGDQIESVTDARGLITRTEYNADRQPVAITTPDGLTVRYEYEAQYGQIARHTDELGIETRYHSQRIEKFPRCRKNPSWTGPFILIRMDDAITREVSPAAVP